MSVLTMSSRAFNQDTSRAKKAAMDGPVIITDRGKPAHVLLTYEAYRHLTQKAPSIIDLMYMPGVADIELEIPSREGDLSREADFFLMYLLDTNVVSEMRKFRSPKIDTNVQSWCASANPAALFLSVVTIKELEQGVIRMEGRDARQGALLRAWLETSVLAVYRDRLLPVTLGVRERAPG